MSNQVDIEDAKALKRWPTAQYTRRHRQLARESAKLWCRLWDDLAKFCGRMLDYGKDPTERKLKIWTASLKKMDRDAKALLDHANQLNDRHEATCLLLFLQQKVLPFMNEWADVLNALHDGGESITMPPINEWAWSRLQTDGPPA